jgi:DNA repair exonuclease SbcCD ATPase subunit
MAQQSKKLETDSAVDSGNTNLVDMKTADKEKKVLEINKQMSSLEGSIDSLNKQLNTTNRQIKKEVERLSASDVEITDKVAETYKQLGVMDNTFKELNKQSSQINTDLKKVNTTIRALEKSTSESLNAAIDNQQAVNSEFKQIHEDLIERAEKLSKKAGSISKKLDKSIKDNSEALTQLESRIVEELQSVADGSKDRDNKLDNKITQANSEISSQKAKILLMQSVDEALDKRASELERTSQLLLKDNEKLKTATETLDVLTSKLSDDVQALEQHTAKLQAQNEEQQDMIDGLQEKSSALGAALMALANLEKKHFRMLGAGSLVLLLAIAALYFYSQYLHDSEATVEAQRNEVVNTQISELQNRVTDEQIASQVFFSEINSLKSEMQNMNDQVESIDGRVQYISPLYNYGTDNTIHGSQWLAQLDENLKSIKIASVASKQELYEIASRYNRYFTDDLGYFVTGEGQYTLVYGGKFASDQQVEAELRHMPRYMNNHLVTAISNAEILKQIQR